MPTRLDTNHQPVSARLNAAYRASRDISEFVGLCKGVLADALVNQKEAEFVLQWLDLHPDVHGVWPANIVRDALDNFLEDGSLSPEEESALLEILISVTGEPVKINQTSGEIHQNASTNLPLSEPELLTFADNHFVLTGKFEAGGRSTCERWIRDLGGTIQKIPTKVTHCIIIGSVGSRDWAHSSFGRKIEKAVALRDCGQDLHIVSEAFFISQLHSARKN